MWMDMAILISACHGQHCIPSSISLSVTPGVCPGYGWKRDNDYCATLMPMLVIKNINIYNY